MLAHYLIFTTSLTTIALIWRAILLDHLKFAEWIHKLPIIGGSLYCGFCTPLWLTFFAVLLYNPLPYFFIISWLVTGAGVLFLRNLIALLMEANGYVTDLHRSRHGK